MAFPRFLKKIMPSHFEELGVSNKECLAVTVLTEITAVIVSNVG